MEEGLRQVFKGELRGRHVETIRIEKHRVKIKEEADLLKLDHPNILRLVPCGNDNDYIYFALELCVGSLNQLFLISDDAQKYSGPMPHHIDALLQLASGLEYIHSKNLVHGNIKPENVLISMGSAGQDETTLKWANFGLTRNIDELGRGRTSPVRENKVWLAPELLSLKLNSTADKREYQETIQSDIFAQGLVFASLLLKGEHLYGSINHENQIPDNIIGRNAINMQKIDGKLRDLYENDLLKKMLKNDPKERMTSTEVVDQLTSIKTQLIEKERELLKLCGSDSRLDVTEKIKNLIQFGINLNAKDNDGRNALHLLCRYYSSSKLSAAINLVIEGGINVNARDPDGLNAIHSLCRYHSSQNLIDSIQILIQSGIDTTAKTNDGSTTLHYLCRYNSSPHIIDAVEILTKLEVNLMERDGSGRSAFYYSHFKDTEMKISFDRKKQIGRGSFSVVFKGMFKGREVAVKRVEIHHVDGREEEPMLKLHHRNIVRLLHCEKDDDFRYYALELCVASLDQLFLKSDNPKKYDGPMPRQIVVFSQLAKGLAYIHSERLIHREIKPSNILIMQCPGKYQEIIIKWSDFGLSKSVNEKGLHSWTGVRGTRTWYAPEVLKKLINGKKAEQEEFWGTVQSDVFVLGLVFGYLFLMGEHLYGSSETEIHKNIIKKKPVNMQKIDEKLRKYYEDDLLMKMLEHDPKKRITSKEVVEQLESINNKLTVKEEELRQLCERDSSSGLIEKINDLIQLGIDVNAKDIVGRNALHYLCENNSNSILINTIQLLIREGVDVNAKDNIGRNALHFLCLHNSNSNLLDAIQFLIREGIDVNAKDNDGQNALHFLCWKNSNSNLIDAIQLLIREEIDVNAKSNYGKNALHFLCRFNSNSNLIDAIRLFIQLGIDVNAKRKDGWNALHYLCCNKSNPNLIHAILLFIRHGIPVVSDGDDARSILRDNFGIKNKDEILKLLDEAALV